MNTRMLVPLVLVAGLMHGQQASATVLPYGNNPFKFCSEGMPSDGWVPVDWRTGTYRYTRRAKRVNHTWIPVYQSVCPLAAVGGTGKATGRAAPDERPASPSSTIQRDAAATF